MAVTLKKEQEATSVASKAEMTPLYWTLHRILLCSVFAQVLFVGPRTTLALPLSSESAMIHFNSSVCHQIYAAWNPPEIYKCVCGHPKTSIGLESVNETKYTLFDCFIVTQADDLLESGKAIYPGTMVSESSSCYDCYCNLHESCVMGSADATDGMDDPYSIYPIFKIPITDNPTTPTIPETESETPPKPLPNLVPEIDPETPLQPLPNFVPDPDSTEQKDENDNDNGDIKPYIVTRDDWFYFDQVISFVVNYTFFESLQCPSTRDISNDTVVNGSNDNTIEIHSSYFGANRTKEKEKDPDFKCNCVLQAVTATKTKTSLHYDENGYKTYPYTLPNNQPLVTYRDCECQIKNSEHVNTTESSQSCKYMIYPILSRLKINLDTIPENERDVVRHGLFVCQCSERGNTFLDGSYELFSNPKTLFFIVIMGSLVFTFLCCCCFRKCCPGGCYRTCRSAWWRWKQRLSFGNGSILRKSNLDSDGEDQDLSYEFSPSYTYERDDTSAQELDSIAVQSGESTDWSATNSNRNEASLQTSNLQQRHRNGVVTPSSHSNSDYTNDQQNDQSYNKKKKPRTRKNKTDRVVVEI